MKVNRNPNQYGIQEQLELTKEHRKWEKVKREKKVGQIMSGEGECLCGGQKKGTEL